MRGKGGHLEDYENKTGLGASHLNNKVTLYQAALWALWLRVAMQGLCSGAGLAPPSRRGRGMLSCKHPSRSLSIWSSLG